MARRRQGRTARSRGEVNEIISQLEHLSAMDGRKPDVVRAKRDCFQKLIRYMTAGIDMSAAFIPATKCVALSKFDLPLKKMLYLYLRSAARQNTAVALLVVQTLLTDSKDADPTVRGLAIRSMCSLRVPDLLDNVFMALDVALKDVHPYVREVAVVGVLKCYHQDPAGTRSRGFIDAVRQALATDDDPQVVANCLYVLEHLGMLSSTIVTRRLTVNLLNHVKSFSDWAQCLVLEILLEYYRPISEAERFDVLEVLDFGLNHTNSAVVMATAKLFLHYTVAYPDQHARVLESIRGPLQTLILGREPEIAYAALANLIVLAERHVGAFAALAGDLFCRPEDPSYLKLLKLDALVAVAERSNAYDAVEEASQYARDPEGEVVKAAVRTVARIALKVAEVDGILDRLLLFLSHNRPDVSSEAVATMADVLRRFPDAAGACVPAVTEIDPKTLTLPAARAAYVWVLGEFGESVQDAPYALESLVMGGFQDETPEVKLSLLTAVAKLFFKRAPECQKTLGAVLAAGAADAHTDVRDRALLYHRLLRSNEVGPAGAAKIIAGPRLPLAQYEESQLAEVRDRIFDEWNSLSAVYRAPASTFIRQETEIGDRSFETDSIGGRDLDDGEEEGGAGNGGGASTQATTALLLDLDVTGDAPGEESSYRESSKSADLGDFLAMGLDDAATGKHSAQPLDDLTMSTDAAALGDLAPSFPQPVPGQQQQQQSAMDMLSDLFGGTESTSQASGQKPDYSAATPSNGGFDDLLGGFGSMNSSSTVHHEAGGNALMALAAKPILTPPDFHRLWTAWISSETRFTQELGPGALSAISSREYRDFVEHLGQANIAPLALPRVGCSPPLRFLLHAQTMGGGDSGRVLVQVTVTAGSASVEIRAAESAAAEHTADLLRTLLLTLY